MSKVNYIQESGAAVSLIQLQRYLLLSHREQRQHADEAYLTQFVERFLCRDHQVWWAIASENPDPAGCLWLGYTVDADSGDRHPYLFLLHVLPLHRRRGVGKTLIQRAETWAKQQGYPKLSLHVFCQNEGAQQFYRQLGYGPQSILMAKNI